MEHDPFIRDEEKEDIVQKMIYESVRGPEPDEDDDDFGSQFLNDVGEGLESEERRDNKVSLTNSGEPSGSSSKCDKRQRGPTQPLSGEGRLALTAFKDSGEPVEPKEYCHKFINQAGVIVRDHVPISIVEWHKPKNAGGEASYVNDILFFFFGTVY